MSGTSGTQASTKGETTSLSKSSKSGYDHLDINKLYKGKSTEPVAKAVTQKHGMQTLGKAPPARRGGSTVVKSEPSTSDVANSSAPIQQPISLPSNIGQQQQHQQQQQSIHPPGWPNALPHPQGPPSPHNAPSVPKTGPPMHDKNWSGGPDRKGNFPSAQDSMQRFAQEFPSLDSGGDTGKGQNANAGGPQSTPGHPQMSKSNQDNQYGPGPILRPQTEGSWTQGGGRGMPRPPGPPPQSGGSTRDFGPERPNLGGPTPPPMSLGQAGHPPPPLGAFPMQYPRPPFMYPNSGPPGPGGFYPQGPMPRYGMPIPPGAPPPPSSHPPDGHREPGRGGRGPPPQPMRPASHFTSKPIIKQEELERMDELGQQDGGWAAVQEDIDYNKKISFSDDENEEKRKESEARANQAKNDRITPRQDSEKRDDERERRSVKILERQQQNDRHDQRDPRERESRYESEREHTSGRYDYDNEDDWKRKPGPGFDSKDRDRDNRDRDRGAPRGRMREEESWRSGSNNRFEEDPRGKKVAAPPQQNRMDRMDPRGPQNFPGSQFQTNLPPRLQRQQQQPPMFTQSGNQKTPSPVPISGSGNAVNKERDYRDRERDRDWERGDRDRDRDNRDIRPTYKILERNRGDSESSKESSRDLRDRRFGSNNDCDTVPVRLRDKDPSKRLSSDSGRNKDDDDIKMSPKDKGELDVDSYHSDSRKQEEAKAAFRTNKPPSTFTSWADEVDDEEYSTRDDDDGRKGLRESITSHMKRDQIYPEERRPRENTVPRRVIIQQTKVENMRSEKVMQEKPEPVVEPKPEPVKQEKPVEKVKSSAWGDRDALRERQKTDQDGQKDNSGKDSDRDTHSSEKEIPNQKTQKSDMSQMDAKSEAKDPENDKSHTGLERKGSREKIDRDRHYDRYGGGRYDSRQEKDNRPDNRNNNLRDRDRDRPKPRRMDSYEMKRDTRTPDRDSFSSANRAGNEASNASNRNSQEKEREQDKTKLVEKSKGPEKMDSMKDKNSSDKSEDFRSRDMDRDKDYERSNRNDRDDYDQRDRGHRGGRGKDRGGYGVYQSRGGSHGSWGSDPKGRGGRGGRGGNSRDFYDKPRRTDQEKEDKPFSREDLRHSESDGNKEKGLEKSSELSNQGSSEDLGGKKKEKDTSQSNVDRKGGNKSPGSSRRNVRGGARLQGYGPPSDKNPFSTNQSHKDEDSREKPSDAQANAKPAPVPLMALGDISPPNLQSKSRHHGGGRELGGSSRGGRGIPPRMQRDDYSFRERGGGNSSKRGGRGDAKPLMSINSNEVEGNEWESESESGDDESKRSGQQSRKEGINKSGSRQSQNVNRNGTVKSGLPKESTSNTYNHQDAANNNKGKGTSDGGRGTASNFEIDCYSGQTSQDASQHGGTSDNSENVDNESGGFQTVQKKNAAVKPAAIPNQKNVRQETKPAKDRRIKNPPYDPRPNSKPSIQTPMTTGTWEKTMPSSQSKENVPQPSTQTSATTVESKDTQDSKPPSTTAVHQPSAVSNQSMLDSSGVGPLKTMIFENTNFKSINNTTKTNKALEPNKESSLASNRDLGKDLQLGIGKVEENPAMEFGTFTDTSAPTNVSQQNTVVPSQPSSKSMPIGQSRSFVSHQPSPISPLAADLNEKVQSVKRIWDSSPMPSVAEQNSVCVSEDNTFHGGFGTDSFKGSDSSREFSSSLQQPTSGYAPGSSPALSAISKPESSSSPTSTNLRISKPQQQNSLDNQGQSGISSSPFGGYNMPQPQGSNAFGIPAVPSPPSVMYGASQTLHAGAPPSGMYQTFPHVDAPQVMGATGRAQYGQYAAPQASSGHYGLFLSTPMEYQSMSSYQHQQGNQGPGQPQNQSTRISPGPMTTTGGGNSAGVIISSTNSLMNMKQTGSGSHPSMQHQVVPGSQQGYSQLSHHHHAAALSHQQHHLGAVGPSKGGYSQSGMATPSQTPVFIPFDPNQQSVINLGQNFLSSGMSRGPPGGPPPPATPPVQALQASSTYYSGSSGNQTGVYPTGSNQGGSLQQLHVAVAPNPQALQGYHNANPQLSLQFPTQMSLQGYNQQAAASTVSALNLGNQLIRNPGPASHSFMKQPGIDMVQQNQLKSSHDSMMNQNTWNSAGLSFNQSFHQANKTGSNQDRNAGNNIGNQRKGNSHAGNVPNMKYMSTGGYSGQQ